MLIINPFSGGYMSTRGRRYDDTFKMGVFDLTTPMEPEHISPKPLEDISGSSSSNVLLQEGEYNLAFEYLFKNGKSVPMNIIAKLLMTLIGYRLSFYHLDNLRMDTFIVSNRTKAILSQRLIVPHGDFLVILGCVSQSELKRALSKAIIYNGNLIERRYAELMEKCDELNNELNDDPSKFKLNRNHNGFIINPESNRMVKIVSRHYKDLFPDTKRRPGRPRKEWDTLVIIGELMSKVDSISDEFALSYADKISNQYVSIIYHDEGMDSYLVASCKREFTRLITEGLSKNYVTDILVGKSAVNPEFDIPEVTFNHETKRPIRLKTFTNHIRLGSDITERYTINLIIC